jgi:hypothetical protein
MTEPNRKDSVKKFVPSTKEELASYSDKYSKKLNEISTDINKTVEATQKTLAAAQMRVGRLLLDAREEFKGDLEFGRWRKDKTCIASSTNANRLMGIAKEFQNKKELVAAMSPSALMELLPAAPEVIKEVEKIIEETGKAPSVRETREMVKEASDATSHEEESLSNRVGGKKKEPVESTESVWQGIVDIINFEGRMKAIDATDYEDEVGAYLLFGLDPLGSIEPSIDLLLILHDYYKNEWPEFAASVDEAYSVIKETSKRRRYE